MSGAGAQAHQLTSADPGSEEEQALYRLEQHKASPIMVNVQVNGVPVSMELDTGAVEGTVPHSPAPATKVIQFTYTAQSVGVMGTFQSG